MTPSGGHGHSHSRGDGGSQQTRSKLQARVTQHCGSKNSAACPPRGPDSSVGGCSFCQPRPRGLPPPGRFPIGSGARRGLALVLTAHPAGEEAPGQSPAWDFFGDFTCRPLGGAALPTPGFMPSRASRSLGQWHSRTEVPQPAVVLSFSVWQPPCWGGPWPRPLSGCSARPPDWEA